MDESTLNIDSQEYLQWDDTMDPEMLIPFVLIDGTKTYVKFGAFIANTDKKKAFADALEHGEFYFYPEYRAYAMDPGTFTAVDTLDLTAETASDQDFYFSRGFAKRMQLQDNLEELKGTQISARVVL